MPSASTRWRPKRKSRKKRPKRRNNLIYAPGNYHDRMHGSAKRGQISLALYHHAQQEVEDRKVGNKEVQSGTASSHGSPRNQVTPYASQNSTRQTRQARQPWTLLDIGDAHAPSQA